MFANRDDVVFAVSLKKLVVICCSLPFGAFILCVWYAVTFHFEGSTRTHCGVTNYLPSISAAIGDFAPERYIWRVAVALHNFPRFMAAISYKNFYLNSPLKPVDSYDSFWYTLACWGVCSLHVMENLCLLVLTYVSSTENHDLHELVFISFLVFSIAYMLSTLFIFNYSGRRRTSSGGEKSFQYKLLLFLVNVSALLSSAYFFYRHNAYCEPGVYTLFASCEYIVVVTNILFHGTLYFDLSDKQLIAVTASSLDWKST